MRNRRRLRLLLLGMLGAVGIVAAALRVPVSATTNPLTTTPIALLSGASALNAAHVIDRGTPDHCQEVAVYIQWSAGTASGAVKIESAHDSSYTGTWAPLATKSWSAASSEDIVQITGIHAALRTRVSTAIMGGTVNTWAVCN